MRKTFFGRNCCNSPEWIAGEEIPCFNLEPKEILKDPKDGEPADCFHEIFREAIFSIQTLFEDSLQSCNKSLINQECSGPYCENIGHGSVSYGPSTARSVMSRPLEANILPVLPSHLVNKIL